MPYPIVLDLQGKPCVVIGASPVAERRVLGLLAEGAKVRVVAPQATEYLAELAQQGEIEWERGAYSANVLDGAVLAFAATDHKDVNEAVARDAMAKNVLVCRTDDAMAGDFMTPAVLRRGDLVIALTTCGKSPTLTAVVRERLESQFGPDWIAWTEIFGRLRERIQRIEGEPARRKAVIDILTNKEVKSAVAAGDLLAAEKKAISCTLANQEG